MSDTAKALGLVLAWVIVAILGDMQFKASQSLASWKFVLAFVCYCSTSFIAFWTYKLQQWGWICLMWSIASLAVGLLLSIVLYGEPFTIRRRIAAALILTAILVTE